jgi:hypothetical protein
MGNAILRSTGPCGPYLNRRFGRWDHLHLQGGKSVQHHSSVQRVSNHAQKYDAISLKKATVHFYV